MSDLSFANPWVLGLLVLVPIAYAAWAWGSRRGARRAAQVSRSRAPGPPYLAATIFALAAALAIVSAAQPRWGTRESKISRIGADLVVVMDISRSMDAKDVAPNRLQAAKDTVNATINRLGGDRVALVVFAGDARVRFPLTTDLAAATQVINSLQTGALFVEGGSSAALGLQEAVTLLEEGEDGGRVILLVTDGDDLGGDPLASSTLVRDSGADLLIVGIGTTEGATVPLTDALTGNETPKLDGAGEPIISRLNEGFLRALAVASEGRYLGSDPTVVAGAVDGRLRALERSQIDARPTIIPVERYQWFAGAALGMLVLASLAERFARMPVRGTMAVAALALLLGGCASEAYEVNEEARAALSAGDVDLAIEKFREAQVLRPDDPEITLNLAAAHAAAGNYEEAILIARRVLATNNAEIRNRAYAAIGHHQFDTGRLNESLGAFRQALIEDPTDDASRHDYEVVLRLLFPPPLEEQPTPPTPPTDPGSGPSETPMPGDSGTPPGGGQGTPGPGTPQPGGPGAGGTPTPGGSPAPGSIAEIDRALRELDQRVNRLLLEAGDEPSAQEATEILRLLAERTRLAQLREALGGNADPSDY